MNLYIIYINYYNYDKKFETKIKLIKINNLFSLKIINIPIKLFFSINLF